MKKIDGNTYPVRTRLAALGGRWDSRAKAWMVPEDKAEQAKALVASAPADRRECTVAQTHAIRNMLRRLDKIGRLDSFAGTGAEHAATIRGEINGRPGQLAGLSFADASAYIDQIVALIEDEM